MKWDDEKLARLNRLIGLPYEAGAEGPSSFYCLGLVRYIKREFYGLDLPLVFADVDSPLAVARALRRAVADDGLIEAVEAPSDGDGCILGQGPVFEHVGLYIDAPGARGVIHAQVGMGVMFQRVTHMAWSQISFFRFVGERP